MSQRKNTRKSPKNMQPLLVEEDYVDRRSQNPNVGLKPGLKFPMPFQSVQVINQKFRFVVSSAIGTQTFMASDLFKLLTFSTAANTGYCIPRALRFKYIEIWEPFEGVGVSTSLAGVFFYGTGATNTGTNDERYAISTAPDTPAHLLARPPKETLIGYWQNVASSLTMFDIRSLSVGATVDISLDYIGGFNQSASNLGPYTITAASAGLVGCHPPTTSLSAVGLNNM